MVSSPLAVLLVLAAVVYLAVRLAEHVALFRSLGAALVAILLAMLLSNLRFLPEESPAYDFLVGPALSFGIALILLSVDYRSIVQAGPRMLAAFGIGALGTAVGATVSGLALHSLVGPETWKLAGQYTGTYTGGGMNFAALGRAFGTSSDLFSAAIAADVAVTALWMAACLAVPVLLGRPGPSAEERAETEAPGEGRPQTLERALHESGRPVELKDTAALAVIGLGSVWAAGHLGALVPQIPEILWLTTLVLLLAQIPAVQALAGGALWGNYLLLLFLASNGARSVIANIFAVGPAVFYFAVATVAVHGVILFGLGRLLRIDMATLAVASQANVGGAASAMALAGARGYVDRLLPGVAVGLLGYAVGNYSGFMVAALVRQVLGQG
ncbi:MAG: DUF819 family protein [Acidobacteriota bacterium]